MFLFQKGAKLAFQRVLKGTSLCEGIWERSPYITSMFTAGKGYHWKQPEGVDTGIAVYNHSTKSKVPLVLQTEGNLKWYVCGPTVYDESHIGHACCFVRFDIIRRILSRIFNINVVYVMNITDISEQVIQRSQQMNKPADELANHYTDKFLHDLKRLNVLPPIMPNVSKNISTIIKFIERLIQDEKAYVTSQGNVYFRCQAYPLYGSFSGGYTPSDDTTDLGDKEAAEDFALWKAQKAGEPHWDSPWGKGHPGWHIECSAIASAMFGSCIDIHSGGTDLKFPHHENEMAQSCCYHNTEQWVNYWIYSGLLRMANDSEKMSKSLGNVISVDELLKKYSANQFRVFCLLSSYGNDIEFGEEQMRKASKIHKKLTSIVSLANSYINDSDRSQAVNGRLLEQSLLVTQKVVKKSLADNFNTAAALAAIMNLVHVCNIELSRETPTAAHDKQACPVNAVAAIVNYIQTIMSDLGVSVSPQQVQTVAGSQEHADQLKQIVDSAVSFREKVRDYCLAGQLTGLSDEEKARVKAHRKAHASLMESCDQLRQELSSLCSITIRDGKDGKSTWSVEEIPDE